MAIGDDMAFGQAGAGIAAWKDAAEFESLVRAHFGIVHAVAFARLRDRDAAEDLTQEVFLRALLQFDPAKGSATFGPWTVRVARNLATDWLRRGRTRSSVLPLVPTAGAEEVADIMDNTPSPRDRASEHQEKDALDAALQELPDELREAVLLHYMEGLTKREIAHRLEVHPSTIGRQIDRAMELLKQALEPALRERLGACRPSASRVARTVAMAAAVSTLAPPATAALAASAPMQEGTAALATAHAGTTITVASAGAGGAATMGFAKIAGACVVVLAGAAVAGHLVSRRPSAGPSKPIPPRPAPMVTPLPASIPMQLPDLPPGWKLTVKPSTPGSPDIIEDGTVFRWNSMTVRDALFTGWRTPVRIVDPKVMQDMKYLDIELIRPPEAPYDDMHTVKRIELQRAFGFRASLEKRMVRSIVLKAPDGVPPAFHVSAGSSGDVEFRGGFSEFTALSFESFVSNIAIQRQMPACDETGIQGRFDFTVPDNYAEDAVLKELGFEVVYEDREAEVLYAIPSP